MDNFFILLEVEPFLASLMSAENSVTLLNDVIAILSHVSRSSSEYVSMVTRVLQGDRGKVECDGIIEIIGYFLF